MQSLSISSRLKLMSRLSAGAVANSTRNAPTHALSNTSRFALRAESRARRWHHQCLRVAVSLKRGCITREFIALASRFKDDIRKMPRHLLMICQPPGDRTQSVMGVRPRWILANTRCPVGAMKAATMEYVSGRGMRSLSKAVMSPSLATSSCRQPLPSAALQTQR